MPQAKPHDTPSPKSRIRDDDHSRDRFDALFSAWLAARVDYLRLAATPGPEALEDSLSEREPDLARALTTFPASQPWMILRKIEVLRFYLATEGGTAWNDNREIVMLAGIEADLLRFPPAVDTDG